MARETIIDEHVYWEFTYNPDLGFYYRVLGMENQYTLTAGQTYVVKWDDVEYTLPAYNGFLGSYAAVFIGNQGYITGTSAQITEPFLLYYSEETGNLNSLALTAESNHKIGLYLEVADPANLILRSPVGEETEYPMRQMLEVDTTEGGTVLYSKGQTLETVPVTLDFSGGEYQHIVLPDGYLAKSAVIVKPENLVPENILKGKTIGGVPGELEVPELEDVTIEPDFSGGDMVVTPDAGKVFSGVTVTKPGNLVPENIPVGINIAGVDGALESGGGGGDSLCTFTMVRTVGYYKYLSSGANYGLYTDTVFELPANSNVLQCLSSAAKATSTSSGTEAKVNWYWFDYRGGTIEKTDDAVKVTVNLKITHSAKYCGAYGYALVMFNVPGIFIREVEDELPEVYADATVTKFPKYAVTTELSVLDISQSGITEIGDYEFYNWTVGVFKFPPAITSVKGLSKTYCAVLDFSLHTSVPTLASAGNIIKGTIIRIPMALYDEWIAATNWTTHADYIVAV